MGSAEIWKKLLNFSVTKLAR